MVSQSTKAMRGRLAAAGIEFSLPLAPLERDGRIARGAALMRRVEDEGDEAVAAAMAAGGDDNSRVVTATVRRGGGAGHDDIDDGSVDVERGDVGLCLGA